VQSLLRLLRQEIKALHPQRRLSQEDVQATPTIEGIHQKIRDQLLWHQVEKAVEAVRMYADYG
jgi:hypothetical protein